MPPAGCTTNSPPPADARHTRERDAGAVAAARSLGLVSVMFDESRASAEQIVSALRRAGFDASVYHPGA